MKLLGLIAVLAVIYYAYHQRLAPGKDSTASAMHEFDQTAPAAGASRPQNAAPAQPAQSSAPATSNLRRPIDRTRAVLEQVKQRNGDGEF